MQCTQWPNAEPGGATPVESTAILCFCHAFQSSAADGIYLPRHASLGCGVPIDRPALGVNRLCGSGFQAVVSGAQDILVGAAKVVLTGGVDSMSQAPFVVRNIRFGTALGTPTPFEDSLWVMPGEHTHRPWPEQAIDSTQNICRVCFRLF